MNTYDRLTRILAAEYQLPAETMQLDARLDNLGVDSLAFMELLFTVEDEFAIKIPNDQIPLATIGDLVDYVDNLIARQTEGVVQPQVSS